MEICGKKGVCSGLFSTRGIQCAGKESLETVWVVSIDKNNWDVMLKLLWCLWSGRAFRGCCTSHAWDRALNVTLSLAQKYQNRYKLNNLSLCMVMDSLQVHKEQIQLVISPDTESPRKRTGAALMYQVGIRF